MMNLIPWIIRFGPFPAITVIFIFISWFMYSVGYEDAEEKMWDMIVARQHKEAVVQICAGRGMSYISKGGEDYCRNDQLQIFDIFK